MGNVGAGEILVILLVGLIVLGPTKLPHAVRQVGRFVGELRRIGAGFRQELRDAVEEPVMQTKATLAAADPRNVLKTTGASGPPASKPTRAGEPQRTTASPPNQRASSPTSPPATASPAEEQAQEAKSVGNVGDGAAGGSGDPVVGREAGSAAGTADGTDGEIPDADGSR